MTNLADLLPAGGGQNNTDFVADGNISAGAPVVLNSDGKIAPISSTANPASFGSAQEFTSNAATWITSCFHAASGNMVVVYLDSGTTMYAVAGTVSGETITWGTPAQVYAAPVTVKYIVYDSQEEVVVLFYRDIYNSNYGTYRTASVSGTGATASISWNTATAWYSGNMQAVDAVAMGGGAGVVMYTNAGSYTVGHRWELASGGATLTMQGYTDFSAYATSARWDMCHDTSTGKIIIILGAASTGYGIIGTVTSGSPYFAISSGSTLYSGYFSQPFIAYDVAANKCLFTYFIGAGLSAKVGTVDVDAGTISFGTEESTSFTNIVYPNGVYDTNASATAISFQNANNSSYCDQIYGTISGTDVTFTAATTILSKALTSTQSSFTSYDSVAKKIVTSIDNSTDSDGESVVSNPSFTNLTSTNLLGIAPEAISNTATGTINTWGSRCENNDFFGTVSATYGSPTAASAYQSESKVLAYDSANNRFVMAYKDGSNSDYGTAVVGELSGTSITWGTPVVFESATTGSNGLDIAFDSNVNRIVIAYQDQGNSSYGTAIVGSVSGSGSGSTIAFGSPTVFESADTRYIGMTFDSNDNRIVIVYSDAGNSYYATYVIGTVTTGPDAISFNTPALLNGSSATYEIDASFDATENKVLVAYTDGSYDLYVLNLAISGGSGTPGTASSFGIGSPQQRFPRCVYDSVNGKSGVAYAEGTNLPIYFSVISMSGSNVTIETRVLAGDTSDSNYFMHNIAFDASNGQLAICTRDASASKGIAYYGSISGTTSSWTTSGSLFADETILTYGVDVAYDTSANKLAFVYSPSSGSNSAAVVGTLGATTLTIGSDYYVQTDGTLSTDTGGQLIGNAIKTNQINIKDYTG